MLYDLVGAAEFDLVYEAAATVRQAATKERVTKIQEKETYDKDGNPITETTTTKEGPSMQAALKILEIFSERWRGVIEEDEVDTEEKDKETYDPLADLVEDKKTDEA